MELDSLSPDDIRDLNHSLSDTDAQIGEIYSGECRISEAQLPPTLSIFIRKVFLHRRE